MSRNTVYLDYAAATPVEPRVLAVMRPYFTDRFYNPSATYLRAVNVRKDIEAARGRVALILGSRPSEIIFTAGATEANNLVIRGVLEEYTDGNVVVSSIEHDSVLQPARLYQHKEALVSPQGIVDMDALRELIDEHTVLVSVIYANNEVGSVQPIRHIALMLEEVRYARRKAGNERPLYLHTDAAQAANYLDLHVAGLGVDFMTLNGGKIYGPKQSGILFAAARTRLKPQIVGGGQERGWRGGTENIAGIMGFTAALELAQQQRVQETVRLKGLQQLFFAIAENNIPGLAVNGPRKHRLPNNVHIMIPGQDNERLLMQLDEAGIMAAAGSACSASDEEPSHVLKALGLSDEAARSSLRFSMGRPTNEDAVRYAASTLGNIIAR